MLLIAAAIRLASPRELPHHLLPPNLLPLSFLPSFSPFSSLSSHLLLLALSPNCGGGGGGARLYTRTRDTYTQIETSATVSLCTIRGSVHNAIQLYTFFPSVYIEYQDIYTYIHTAHLKLAELNLPPSHPPAAPRKRGAHVNDRPPRPLSFPPHLRATSGTPGSLRLARGERKGKKGKGRNDDFIPPPPPPPRLIPAAKIFARTVEDHRARGKVYVYRAREVQTEDETRHPPSIFSSSTPIPTTRAEQRLGRGRFLQIRFVWVSTMRGWRGFSLSSLPFSFPRCRMVSHFLLE